MSLRAELRCPLDVFAGLGVKGTGEALFLRQHVARPCLTPLRLVFGGRAEVLSSRNQAATQQQTPNSKPPAAEQKVEQDPRAANPTSFHDRQSSANRALQLIPLRSSPKDNLKVELQPRSTVQRGWSSRFSVPRQTGIKRLTLSGNVPLPEHAKLMTLQDLFGNIVILHAQAKDGFALGMRDEGI